MVSRPPAAGRRAGPAQRRRRHRVGRRPPGGRRPRPVLPGRAHLPVADRRGEHRDRARAAHRRARPRVRAAARRPAMRESEEDVAFTVDDLVELLGLGAFRDKFVSELSTGSRRIVDLAMSIAHDPKVLLLDEPTPAASPSARPRRSGRCCSTSGGRPAARCCHRARHAADHRRCPTRSSPSSSARSCCRARRTRCWPTRGSCRPTSAATCPTIQRSGGGPRSRPAAARAAAPPAPPAAPR